MVVYSHSVYIGYFFKKVPSFTFMAFNNSKENLAGIAVGGFFVLSGYLITASYLKTKSVFRFLWKRFLRVFPGYWFCLLVSAFILGPFAFFIQEKNLVNYFNFQSNSPFSYIYKNFFLFQIQNNIANSFSHNFIQFHFNDSLWTLFYEFICYLSLVFLGTLGIFKKPKKIILGIFIILWLTFNLFFTRANMSYYPFITFKLFTYFYMGAVFYLFRDQIILDKIIMFFLLLITIGFIYIQQFFLIAPFVIAYSLFMAIDKIHINNFDRFGDFSYGLYLFAFPIGQILAALGIDKLGFFIFYTLTILLGTDMAVISFWLIESRFLKLKK